MSQSTTKTLHALSIELRQRFDEEIRDFSDGLWKYCRYLTGSPWDGEDLFQETMLKALGGLYTRWQPTNLKSYLYRTATNAWIDYCRKEKRSLGVLGEEHEPIEEFSDSLDLEEALEKLYELFTPRQTAVFLLMEIFRFKAEEVASIVKTTPGAVYATTRRMKTKLKENKHDDIKYKPKNAPQKSKVIQAYLNAFNDGDIEGMLSLISDHAHYEASLGFLEVNKDEIREGSLAYGLPGHHAIQSLLWGKPVIVVLAELDQCPQVHDIQYQEVENGKIVYHRSFFFRKEFIVAASKELGYAPQLNKPPLNWTE
ncbi:sigma-70 family RNA polymerase sigma factor [Fictibacillus sp. b24]|uniref:sigma-70 family RNA polymerase sigma factor n=1 Tax=Fictibacillus sp. b24 TaxID=3055863 RepID=UPI0025A176C5|nr:sigma-70 family RNA polymerase sigma factor [Fictibacillus sp. b24]MDM5317115.1 sigma-70 family RNA polymerase sigma factor [Fictibacillus sp. b24]